ncbi:MAG: TonB-dependent receptor [Saprospiraceae bacterium]|nr:TonB-dependent receptor [Saprospiraceae bacterium]
MLKTRILFFGLFLFGASVLQAQNLLRRTVQFGCPDCSATEALAKLSQQENIAILFPGTLFDGTARLRIPAQKYRLGQLLDQIAANVPHEIVVSDGQVLLRSKKEPVKRFTLSGYLRDAETGERLIGATIMDARRQGVVSNEFGFYSMQLESGEHLLRISYIGYDVSEQKIQIGANQTRNFDLKTHNVLSEVTITAAAKASDSLRLQVVPAPVPLQDLKSLPMPGSIPDVIRQVSLGTGVLTGADGLGGLNIRGGNADQNLILLDDVPVYNASHALGLVSIFNADMISTAKLWKGDQPARFGARSSSVLEVRTRDGDLYHHRQQVNVCLFALGLLAEGPIKKGKCSYIIGTRSSSLLPIVRVLSRRENLATGGKEGSAYYQFTDFNAKLNYVVSPNDRLYLSCYAGLDTFGSTRQIYNQFDTVFERSSLLIKAVYGNQVASLRWNHLWGDRLFSNTTATYSLFNYKDGVQTDTSNLIQYAEGSESRIQDIGLKTDFTFFANQTFNARMGISATQHFFQPGIFQAQAGLKYGSNADTLQLRRPKTAAINAFEGNAYMQTDWQINDQMALETGLNTSLFIVSGKNYLRPDPRLRLLWKPTPPVQIFFSFSGLTQNLHQVGSFSGSLPFELWAPTTANNAPERVWQSSIGVELRQTGWILRVEAYDKVLRRLRAFRSSQQGISSTLLLENDNWQQRLILGKGWSLGLEITLFKSFGNTSIDLAYTLSRTFRQFEDANLGNPFPARYDRPHDLKLSLVHHFNRHWDASVVWVFGSGNPITLAGLKFNYTVPGQPAGPNIIAFEKINNYRLPAYHRLDLAVTANFERKRLKHSLQFGIFNAYNRQNPFFVSFDPYLKSGNATQFTLLPFLPSFRYVLTRK